MTATISEHYGVLVVKRCWCGIQHAVPQSLHDLQRRQHDEKCRRDPIVAIYCPLGHRHYPAGESDREKVEKELNMAKAQLANSIARHDQTRAALRDTEKKLIAQKSAKTRLKNRISRGVCPCCNRSFENVRRHMETKHPEELQKKQE